MLKPILYNDLRNFGEWLKQAKAETGVTNIDLSRGLGMEKCTFSRYVRGKQFPTIATVVRICDFLGYTLVIRKKNEFIFKNGDENE